MIQRIEELSMNAFPALSNLLVNGWVLRFADGYAKRANSVAPLYPCAIDFEENITLCEKIYGDQKLDSVFKLTECDSNFQIDKLLENKGYRYEAKTNILLKSLRKEDEGTNLPESVSQSDVLIYRTCNEEWFDAFSRMNKVNAENKVTLRKILLSLIPDAFYAAYKENNEIIAVGLGVAERGYIGMFDIFVNEDHRRKGLATKIMNTLLSEGAKHGCDYSYLQVVDANENAKLLYKKLGYEKQYSYWYRVKSRQSEK